VAATPLAPRRATAAALRARPIAWYAAPAAALLSVGAGYVHLAYVGSHWRDWWAYGVFFLATGIFQVLYGVLVLRRPRALVALLGVAANLGIVGMYVISRTEGVPLGPHEGVKEQAGAIDIATTASEIVLVAVLLLLVAPRVRRWTLNLLLVAGLALWVMRLSEGV
jgi:hypothetical protein